MLQTHQRSGMYGIQRNDFYNHIQAVRDASSQVRSDSIRFA